MRASCPAAVPTRLQIKKLFSYCPEIYAEFGRLFGGPKSLLDLTDPKVLYDEVTREAWLRFSVGKFHLKQVGLSVPALISQVRTARSGYVEVKSADDSLRVFQSEIAKSMAKGETPWSTLASDVTGFNGFAFLGRNGNMTYHFPVQTFPFRIPQLLVSYTLLFWLGSLVRYDPHRVQQLMDSEEWILIDGFMSQSRLWLLELFEWAFYQVETKLTIAR
jgi:YaaC-like Protein